MMDFQQQIDELIKSQVSEWDLASKNYSGLASVVTRAIPFGSHDVLVQFNAERMRSSAAKVDAKSIEARPCFLCQKNLPPQQRGVPFGSDYMVLINPFPIFPEHLTIPKISHTDQLIDGNVGDMLELAKALDRFTIFYNGPKCGASAPDHFHFQAGIKGFLPIEGHYREKSLCYHIKERHGVALWGWKDYLRGVVTLEGTQKGDVVACFDHIYSQLKALQPQEVEPMLNILALYEDERYVLHIFPRQLHRPSQFFAEGEEQILLSPASVDMGGVLITPREEDFSKISVDDVRSIFEQVSMSQHEVEQLVSNF